MPLEPPDNGPSVTFDLDSATASEWTDPEMTIQRTPPSGLGEAATVLKELEAEGTPLPEELQLLGPLGVGGMGVVQLANQRNLGRQVAVKSVRAGAPYQSARRRLLQEAWAAASLEHPNVVPVYDVVADEHGFPHVVMRRIQGQTWNVYLHRPDLVREKFGARDLLSWHLGVLQQVCHAVSFAHAAGILHRDLKPDNVMIGSFGEVYVVDWGLAVRFAGEDDGRLPHSRDETTIVGTPRYMAPEMARKDTGPLLSEATDVYLLGGLLYTVITGFGPHPGTDPKDTVRRIPEFVPRLPAGTPSRLVGLVEQAMAQSPGDRLQSAEALRLGIQAHLEERGAEQVALEARHQLDALRQAVLAVEPDRQEISMHWGAARFGFSQALRIWPEHQGAQDGLRETLLTLCRFELSQGRLAAAELLLNEISEPPEDLLAGRDALVAAEQAERRRLAHLEKDLDSSVGQRTRLFVSLIIVLMWALGPLLNIGELDEPLAWTRVIKQAVKLVFVAGVVYWARDSLKRSALNRRVALVVVSVQGAMVVEAVGEVLMGFTVGQSNVLDLLLYTGMSAVGMVSISRALVVPTIAFAAAFIAAAQVPSQVVPLTIGAVLVLGASVFAAWYPKARGKLLPSKDERERLRAGTFHDDPHT